jgi:hypothetical protein
MRPTVIGGLVVFIGCVFCAMYSFTGGVIPPLLVGVLSISAGTITALVTLSEVYKK